MALAKKSTCALVVTALSGALFLTACGSGGADNAVATQPAPVEVTTVEEVTTVAEPVVTTEETTATAAVPEEATAGTEAHPSGDLGVTAEAASAIRFGMSPEEVQAIVGAQPTSHTTSEVLGTTVDVSIWTDATRTIAVGFTNGAVSYIQAINMTFAPAAPPTASNLGVSEAAAEAIHLGMSSADVQSIIGSDPVSRSQSDVMGNESEVTVWVDGLNSITVTLVNDQVVSIAKMTP